MVATPTLPKLLIVNRFTVVVAKFKLVLDATRKSIPLVAVLFANNENCAQGVVVPSPTRPEKTLVPFTMSAGVEVPHVLVAL